VLNLAQHAIEITKYLMIPESHYAVAASFDPTGTPFIRSALLIMLPTIQLNHESGLAAGEVYDEGADQRLATKV
jgi:hypothetical protein